MYKEKYLKTYIWSGLSLVLGFVSMFIVAPLTSSMPEAYGVYSLCISFNIFLRYADLGFIAAGRKYAAEAFSVNNHELEKKYVGTSMSFYGGMTLILFIAALFFSAFPEYIIKDIENSPYYDLSHKFLLILSFTFPLSIFQSFCNLIYSIRIETYKIQCVQIFGSIVKIASVPLYFFNNRYDIVGYYLFSEVINVLVSLLILYNSKKIGYGFKEFFKCLRFDKKIFNEIKPLALSGFASVIGWITYYELDTVGISILLGANAVAIYAIGKQIQTFVRSFINIVFAPYPVRINYFIGQKDFDGLKKFYFSFTGIFSFVIIPIVVIVLFAKPFVISWVGHEYEGSVLILRLLVLTFIFHYMTSLGSSIIYGLNKVKDILRIAVIQPFFFWIGVLVTYRYWGIASFAIFKLFACMVTELYTCFLTRKYLNYENKEFYWHLMAKPMLVFVSLGTALWLLLGPLLGNVEKGHQDLLYVILLMGASCIVLMAVDYCFNRPLRDQAKGIVEKIRFK